MAQSLQSHDIPYLKRCLELAEEAVNAGDHAFGSVLVDADGKIRAEARNRVNEKTALAHPEYDLALWAAENLTPEECASATLYTTGEHCPMCAGAHGWAQVGTIVYLSSAQQLTEWQQEAGQPDGPINFLPVEKIIKNIVVRGPGEGEMLNKIKALHQKVWQR